ncbi:MAG: hypothetical protein Q7S27_05105 [Nanoarchaeota archaeon]|nr:hypothetical protein [Nanoarchaeota archaeon]
MSKDRIDVFAVEECGGYFHVLYGENELVLYEGGCGVDSPNLLLRSPYDELASRVTIPRRLFDTLKKDIEYYNSEIDKKITRHYDEDMEKVEARIIRNENRLARIAINQGVDLEDYLGSYNGL